MSSENNTAISPSDLRRVREIAAALDPPVADDNISFVYDTMSDCWCAYDNGGSRGTKFSSLDPQTGVWE